MLGARLIGPAAARGKGAALPASPASLSAAASLAAQQQQQQPRGPAAPLPPLLIELPFGLSSFALPADFADRVLVGFFGATVIGQLYAWPIAIYLLAGALRAAAALLRSGRPLLAAAAAAAALLLLLYLRYILGAGFREAEVTPNVLAHAGEAGTAGGRRNKWFQAAPLKRWRQWTRLRRHTGAALVRWGPTPDPSRNYVWAGYPHGISAISAFANLVVDPAPLLDEPGGAAGAEEGEGRGREEEAGGGEQADSDGAEGNAAAANNAAAGTACHRGHFLDLFPGIAMHPMTLASNFKAPLVRDYCLALGLRPATRTSCAALLTEPTPLALAAAPPPPSPLLQSPTPPPLPPTPPPSSAAAAAAAAPIMPAERAEEGLRRRRPNAGAPAADDAARTSSDKQQQADGDDDDDDGADGNDPAPPPPPALAFRPSPGRAIFLSPGGAAEALLSRPGGHYDVIMARRKGFCRVAVATGADVVPVVMFGETELFDVVPLPAGSLGWRLQRLSHRTFGTSQPIFRGEGLLGADRAGLLPRRWVPGGGRPRLTTVVGQPVRNEGGPWAGGGAGAAGSPPPSWPPRIPKRGADPAFEAAVDALHARYVAAFKALFAAHVGTFHPGAALRIVDGDDEEDGEGGGGGGETEAHHR